MVLAVPLHLGKLGGRCVSIKVLKMDSWRVKSVFKSNNGVSYEAISSYMYKLSDHPKITEGILFECYPSTKKFLLCSEVPNGELQVEVNEEAATFKVDILQISKFIVGGPPGPASREPGEPYCRIPVKCLKLLNKFLERLLVIQRLSFVKMRIISYFWLIRSTIIPIFD